MHKKTLHSLLIVSFIAVFAASMSFAADEVIVESKGSLLRCADNSVAVTANLDDDVSAIEIVVEVTGDGCLDLGGLNVVWTLDPAVLTDRVIDIQGSLIRIAAMSTVDPAEYLAAGTHSIATIEFTTNNCCEGTADIAGATWPSAPPFGPILTQFIDATTSTIRTVAVTTGVVGVTNKTPYMVEIAGGPFTILHGDLFTYTLEADDADFANDETCETLTFALVSGPEGMTAGKDLLREFR